MAAERQDGKARTAATRRQILALAPLLCAAPLALRSGAETDEILLLDGWVLRRSDLARF